MEPFRSFIREGEYWKGRNGILCRTNEIFSLRHVSRDVFAIFSVWFVPPLWLLPPQLMLHYSRHQHWRYPHSVNNWQVMFHVSVWMDVKRRYSFCKMFLIGREQRMRDYEFISFRLRVKTGMLEGSVLSATLSIVLSLAICWNRIFITKSNALLRWRYCVYLT